MYAYLCWGLEYILLLTESGLQAKHMGHIKSQALVRNYSLANDCFLTLPPVIYQPVWTERVLWVDIWLRKC